LFGGHLARLFYAQSRISRLLAEANSYCAILILDMTQPFCGQRISIVGTSGSGKTTLARQISQVLQMPHIELDALQWEPNWTTAEPALFRSRVEQALQGDRWVVDGNYSKVRDLVWGRADTVIWLDYAFPVVFRRIFSRTLWRGITNQELWNGNRETLKRSFNQDSMILWVLRTYHRRRKEYPVLLARSDYAHLKQIRLHSPKSTTDWLLALSQQSEAKI
jgi:adenylate kinase family enzyme